MDAPEPATRTLGILLVDDHPVVRSGIRALIEKHGMVVVGEAGNGTEALAIATREQPEIILLDLCLEKENGIDLIPDILAVAEAAKIIVVTALRDEDEFRRAIRQGALGIISKGAPADLLLKAIDRVNAGELWLNRHMTATVVTELRRAGDSVNTVVPEDAAAQLTAREREIIALVGEGLKNKDLAERLFISETTVRHHLTSILRKLNVCDRVELLIFAYRNNLVAIKH